MKDESNVFATLLPSSVIGYSVCCTTIYTYVSVYCLVLVCGLPMQMYMNHVAFIIIISYLGIGQHISYSYIIFILYIYMAKADVEIHHTSIHMHV